MMRRHAMIAALLAPCLLLASVPSAKAQQAMPAKPMSIPVIEPSDPPTDPGPVPDPSPPGTPATTQLCAADLNGNGDAADPGEIASCTPMANGSYQCPLGRVACTSNGAAGYACPLGAQYSCLAPTGGGVPQCSPNVCADTATHPFVTEPPIEDPGVPADGAADADGNCTGTIEIFSGRGMRCRPPGVADSLSDCCKDKGKIIKDGMGSSLSSLGTKIAVAQGVFNGMQAAFAAFQAGASAGAAASSGANALIIGFDPTSIAISLAINFMIEVLLQGCDQEDMETGMLRGSGMCHEVGTYCTVSFLGVCVQKAKSHCCFNTKLGRIIQEQGRPQLKSFNAIGWGPVKHPMCRGFTPEEFQALDFSKIDFSEYYADIEARAQTEIQIDMKDRVDAYLKAVQ
ncbi:MAG: conjugal transfer protein TraN [Bradyrhizobium sp.]|nr:conjugal transfer protein TraN [Bradyrhizobium sp.]